MDNSPWNAKRLMLEKIKTQPTVCWKTIIMLITVATQALLLTIVELVGQVRHFQ